MEILVAAVVLALAFAALAWPLYAGRPRALGVGSNAAGELMAQRDGAYAMLRDLDQDHELGKLDDADYAARREKYLARAAKVLQELDTLRAQDRSASARSDEIEQEVAALRKARGRSAAGNEAGKCRKCGQPYKEGDRYCAKCGQALS